MQQHLERQNGAGDDASFIYLFISVIWISWDFYVDNPPYLDFSKKFNKDVELFLMRRFCLARDNIEKPMSEEVASLFE